jgi:hypothetical protein
MTNSTACLIECMVASKPPHVMGARRAMMHTQQLATAASAMQADDASGATCDTLTTNTDERRKEAEEGPLEQLRPDDTHLAPLLTPHTPQP